MPSNASASLRNNAWPWLAIIAILLAATFQLHHQGRLWLCTCGTRFWSGNICSSENSQQFLDPYSFTHVLHGMVFFILLKLLLPRVRPMGRLCLAIAIEAGWEVFENTNLVIERYRAATAALGYTGDTVVNSLGDILSCALGFMIARSFGWRRSAILFVVTEIVLLVWIRDGLTLNIIMLIHPIEAIRTWQMCQ
ncbi:MAG TPA: DUF2585 family protein [Pyrinomonadaceae bacterium]|nr:DUF2585 family protein [Pyrinomonadaceae bacterium]